MATIMSQTDTSTPKGVVGFVSLPAELCVQSCVVGHTRVGHTIPQIGALRTELAGCEKLLLTASAHNYRSQTDTPH